MNIETAKVETGLDIVIKNLLEKHPIQLDIVECGKLIDVSESAARTARHRKTFPIKTQKINGRVVIFTHNLIDYLRTGLSVIQEEKRLGKGRPTKVEEEEAKRRSISVRELRAQQQIAGV